jgi:hypothetical protein
MRKQHFCKCGNKIAYSTFKYGNRNCRSCANTGTKNPMSGQHSWNYKGRRKCSCGRKIENFYAKTCRLCYLKKPNLYVKKGKNHYNYKTGKPICKCGKELKNYSAKRCHVCEMKRRWRKGVISMTKDVLCRHHLDLNIKNDKKSNILYLTHGNHQLFHRFAYHYLLEKFGIKEILKYKKWFKTKYLNENRI